MSVQPLRDYLVVTKEEGAKTTEGGLYIAHTEEKNATGTVVAVGSGRITMSGVVVPLEVAVGDKIMFNKNLATEAKDGNKVVFVLREDQVICILR
jgi:chaperonin GroES